MEDHGRYEAEPFQCYECERDIPIGETCFSINIHAEQMQADGSVAVLGAASTLLLCRRCADGRITETIENPFGELLRAFPD